MVLLLLRFTNQKQGFDPRAKSLKRNPRLDQRQIPSNVKSHDQTNKDHMTSLFKLALQMLTDALWWRKKREITNKTTFKMSCSYAIP